MFIDESGSKNSSGGFFVVGFVKSRATPSLARDMRDIRQRHGRTCEAKFGSISKANLPFYFDLVEMLAAADVRVGGSVYDSRKHFGSDEPTWQVQARMSAQLVIGNTNRGELLNVFADVVETPRGESAAKRIQEHVNGTLRTRAVIAAYDLDSRASDLLQLADIVAGAIAYGRKMPTDMTSKPEGTPKAQVAARFRRAFGLDSFQDVREGKVNILTMKDNRRPCLGLRPDCSEGIMGGIQWSWPNRPAPIGSAVTMVAVPNKCTSGAHSDLPGRGSSSRWTPTRHFWVPLRRDTRLSMSVVRGVERRELVSAGQVVGF